MFEKIRWFIATQIRRTLLITYMIVGVFLLIMAGSTLLFLEFVEFFFPDFGDFSESVAESLSNSVDNMESRMNNFILFFYSSLGCKIYKIEIERLSQAQIDAEYNERRETIKKYGIRCQQMPCMYLSEDGTRYIKIAAISELDYNFLRLTSNLF